MIKIEKVNPFWNPKLRYNKFLSVSLKDNIIYIDKKLPKKDFCMEKEACKILNIHIYALKKSIKNGYITTYIYKKKKVRRKFVYFSREELNKFKKIIQENTMIKIKEKPVKRKYVRKIIEERKKIEKELKENNRIRILEKNPKGKWRKPWITNYKNNICLKIELIKEKTCPVCRGMMRIRNEKYICFYCIIRKAVRGKCEIEKRGPRIRKKKKI